MRRKPWMSVIFLVMIAALLITWAKAPRLRHGVFYDHPTEAHQEGHGFRLDRKARPDVLKAERLRRKPAKKQSR
jgi:hypothetical protein